MTFTAGTAPLPACGGVFHGPEAPGKSVSLDPPAPIYEVRVDLGVRVPMRDGVELATDVYRPVGVMTEMPTIMIRTQYGKAPYRPPEARKKAAMIFAGQGYAVVVQELRGLFDSGGFLRLGRIRYG
jgi:predicted acyl esterase